jgi:hypothetical protein
MLQFTVLLSCILSSRHESSLQITGVKGRMWQVSPKNTEDHLKAQALMLYLIGHFCDCGF